LLVKLTTLPLAEAVTGEFASPFIVLASAEHHVTSDPGMRDDHH